MQTFKLATKQAAKFKEHKDCAVKAVSIVCRVSYKKAHAALKDQGRINGQGTPDYMMARAIKSLGFDFKVTYQPRQKNGSRYTMITIGKGFPHGSCLVFVNAHVAAVKRGVVQDWSDGRKHQVNTVWRVKKVAS